MGKKPECEFCEGRNVHEGAVKKALGSLPDEEKLLELAGFFKVYGDTTRIKILWTLLEGELCVCDLAEILGMSQSAISHQLRLLKEKKLVRNRKEGRTVYYSLADHHIISILSQGMEHVEE